MYFQVQTRTVPVLGQELNDTGHSSDDPPVCLDILNIGHEEENGSLFPSLSYASIHDESQQMEEGMDRTECTDPSDKPAETDCLL